MRRSIFAILTIACLQVAYMAYFQYELSSEQLSASLGSVAEPFVMRTVTADISAADKPTVFEVFGTVDDEENAVEYVTTANYTIDNIARDTKKAARRSKRGFRVNNIQFDSTVITVTRSDPYKFNNYSEPIKTKINYTVNVRPEPDAIQRPKKKNVFRKALPIVKKPYDWMRSFGRAITPDTD